MKKIVLILLLGILGCGGYLWYRHIVAGTPERPGIAISGTIETTETDASFQIAGKINRLLVDEGDRVHRGQLLATLDESDLLRQMQAAQHAHDAAQSQIPQLQSRVTLSQAQTAARVAQARESLAEAHTHLRELMNGSRPQDIQQAVKDVDAARTTMRYLKTEYGRAERLYRADAMPGEQRDTAKSNYDVAVARYHQARERLSLSREGNREEDIQAGRDRVREAEAALALAQTGPLETQTLTRQNRTLAAQMRESASNLAYIKTQLSHTRLYAPADGIVLVKPRELGEVVSPGTAVVTTGGLRHVYLKAYVGDTDLGKVHLGQAADVTIDSSTRTWRGRIYYIASEAEFTPKNLQTKEDRVKLVYRIKIALDNPEESLKPGMIADGLILPETSPPARSH